MHFLGKRKKTKNIEKRITKSLDICYKNIIYKKKLIILIYCHKK